MNPLKSWISKKFGINYDSLTPVKKHVFDSFEAFNEMAEEEINSTWARQAYDYIRVFITQRLIRKPDQELREKMQRVYVKMSPLFENVGMSIEIKASESLGSIKIPRVGELGKVLDLTPAFDEVRATMLLKELFK
jgi:hypothetical protein